MVIYLDESGDLGFDTGGSTYFVIAFVVTEDPNSVKRIVRRVKKRNKLPTNYEMKGSKTPAKIKESLLKNLARSDIEVHSIVVNKPKVLPHLRRDTNLLYNYVACLLLAPYIAKQEKVSLVIDKRILKVGSGTKLDGYLKYKVLCDYRSEVEMTIHHEDSAFSLGIQAADVVCNSIFRKYESGDMNYYKLFGSQIRKEKRLFF